VHVVDAVDQAALRFLMPNAQAMRERAAVFADRAQV
jgi:hypothetical protein